MEVAEGSINALKKYRVKDDVRTVKIEVDEKTIIVYREFLIKAQTLLRANGYRVRADGKFGARTKSAFQEYKMKRKIAGPGMPDAFFMVSILSK